MVKAGRKPPDQVANDKFGDWNSQEAVLQAANYCAEWREQCLRDKISFVFETVFSAEDKIDFLCYDSTTSR